VLPAPPDGLRRVSTGRPANIFRVSRKISEYLWYTLKSGQKIRFPSLQISGVLQAMALLSYHDGIQRTLGMQGPGHVVDPVRFEATEGRGVWRRGSRHPGGGGGTSGKLLGGFAALHPRPLGVKAVLKNTLEHPLKNCCC
jgi:hypothetical protein